MVGVGMPWIGVPTTAQYVDTDLCPNVRWSFKKSDFFFFGTAALFTKQQQCQYFNLCSEWSGLMKTGCTGFTGGW